MTPRVDSTPTEDKPEQYELSVRQALWRDVVVLLRRANMLGGYDRDALRRAFVRTGFSLVEATLAMWRDFALEEDRSNAWANGEEPALTEGERVCLERVVYGVSDKGELRRRRLDIELVADLKFTVRCLAKVREWFTYERIMDRFDVTSLQLARKARNRLTHPKHPDDLLVSDAEIEAVKRSLTALHAADVGMTILEIQYLDGTSSSDPPRWDEVEGLNAASTARVLCPPIPPSARHARKRA